jgi:hypothetical protein
MNINALLLFLLFLYNCHDITEILLKAVLNTINLYINTINLYINTINLYINTINLYINTINLYNFYLVGFGPESTYNV